MKISLGPGSGQFEQGVLLLKNAVDISLSPEGIAVEWQEAEQLRVVWDGTRALLQGKNTAQFFRGLGILKERLSENRPFQAEEVPVFDELGASFDLSRNAVMTVDSLTRMLCRMALMGYTEAYLYTEDTYELPDYPFFGYLRGRCTAEEIRELDEKAAALGIELIPCIQTLGHLERFLHWESSAPLRDTSDVLLTDDSEGLRFIDAMLRQCRSCYRTHKIHVGMDEAVSLGLGSHLKKHGYQDSFSIMLRHVQQVLSLAQKYDFQPMMWSDMYFRCASPTGDYYETSLEIPDWVTEKAPEDMELVYWDYYHREKDFYDRYIQLHQKFSAPLRFAGGMWTWMSPAVDYEVFFQNAAPSLHSCLENGIKKVILTTWGDDGAEASPQAMLLGLQAYAEFCYEQTLDAEWIFKRLYTCAEADGNALYALSGFHKTEFSDKDSDLPNGAKFLLYQDPLAGIFDLDIEGMGFAEQYAQLEELFCAYAAKKERWRSLYLFYALLARVLKNKAELGISLYRAYGRGEKDTLGRLAGQAREASDDCGELLEQWRTLWLEEYKPFGFEILEIRLAGVQSRLKTAARRVEAYCQGALSHIPELEEPRLPVLREKGSSKLHGIYFWKDIVSAAKS